MDIDEDRNELVRLFWGVIKPYDTIGSVPAGTESIGIATALTRALAIVLHRQAEEVRAALRRVEDALPNQREYAEGHANILEYNLRITRAIRSENARLDRLEAEVERAEEELR